MRHRRPQLRLRLLAVGVLVVLLSGAAACGSNDANTEEELEAELAEALGLGDDIEVDVDLETDIVSVESERGSFVRGEGQDRPAWLPAGIPLPDDLDIDWTSQIGGISRLAGVTTTDAGTLSSEYAVAAEAGQWTVEPNPQPISDEEVIVLALLADGTPLDVRLKDGTLELFLGRFWPTQG